ncbi:hypothetical protein COEREDRAFT_78972 [Coemansia reversa NRRL 1564]|uniref:Uncharacterized protein n=1 Tax=Coemansia reversa (strain ATCC 12441 / NRRL 1564) TaxID=763665 RepID=A0A2G5BKX1_COERN|nr:hypothetical protein COEREDRAFT_78972 [Coemansia reversa NRRL 1564]|eukprot:PIA19665.1 hypothetical protein COEREDRAFT_78972 [Coemansia reversa NRRL 1564]
MSSRLNTLTDRLSKLMLKRWTMLAESCQEDGCSAPLMRDPETGQHKCVWHDVKELFPDESDNVDSNIEDKNTSSSFEHARREDEKLDSNSVVVERDLVMDKSADGEDDRSRQRRERQEQGDLASQEIGKRLLQGWAMIDRVCPKDTCFNVPLVQDRDKVQECVICGQRYMDEDAYAAKYGNSMSKPAVDNSNVSKEVPKLKESPTATAPSTAKVEATMPPLPTDSLQPAAQPSFHETSANTTPGVKLALSALDAKAGDLARQLTAATDLDVIRRISHVISTCATAIQECREAVRDQR